MSAEAPGIAKTGIRHVCPRRRIGSSSFRPWCSVGRFGLSPDGKRLFYTSMLLIEKSRWGHGICRHVILMILAVGAPDSVGKLLGFM